MLTQITGYGRAGNRAPRMGGSRPPPPAGALADADEGKVRWLGEAGLQVRVAYRTADHRRGRHDAGPDVERVVFRVVLRRSTAYLGDNLFQRQGDHRGGLQLLNRRRLQRRPASRSEEHTSELQSLMRISYAV